MKIEFLDLLEKAGRVQVTPNTVAAASRCTSAALMSMMGVHPNQVTEAALVRSRAARQARPNQ